MDVISSNQTTVFPETTTEAYDHEGAMKFIISTVLVYSLLGIVSMMVSRLRKKSNSYRRQLDDDVQHFIKTGKTLRESFRRQQLIFRRNTFVKMIKTNETIDELDLRMEEGEEDNDDKENKQTDENRPKVTFHIENETEREMEQLELEELPVKTFADSSCQTDDEASS
ncbi:uncharacterized protein LOC134279572 [Saccostrea cucullata]|uniref:uncharacterized protein LOC134279572 n=1 Tax=Saccostrea cuccullata TaxID=36930 RepID=UPI002ED0BB46